MQIQRDMNANTPSGPTVGRQRFERLPDGRLTGGVVHGKSRTPEYRAWINMVSRCENPNAPHYADYGGRGISIHPSWRGSFEKFLEDVGPRPSSDHSLDRQEVNGNYEPGNVLCKTQRDQNRNKRSNIFVTLGGVKMTLVDAVDKLGLKYNTVLYRIRRGKTPEQALGIDNGD